MAIVLRKNESERWPDGSADAFFVLLILPGKPAGFGKEDHDPLNSTG